MENNKRPETMERITTAALAEAFVAEKVAEIRAQVGGKEERGKKSRRRSE